MEPILMESNPLVEENRNQVAIKRGPLVYCLESADLADGYNIDDILIPADIKFSTKKIMIDNSPMVSLVGEADLLSADLSWQSALYRPVTKNKQKAPIRLIPYYAWGNREKGEMTIWMPLSR